MIARSLCAAAALLVATSAVAGEMDIMGKSDLDSAQLWEVKPGAKAVFHKNYDEGCPALTAACRTATYVVGGDQVIGYGRTGAMTEVEYVSAKGVARRGYVDTALLIPSRRPATPWTGDWMRVEASIRIDSARTAGQYRAVGDATWGASDPERVKRGAINIGEFAGVFTPRAGLAGLATGGADEEGGTRFTLADGSTATSFPLGAPGDYRCRVAMRLVGPYLLVGDNMQCGGMNVSFTGTYVRKPAAKATVRRGR